MAYRPFQPIEIGTRFARLVTTSYPYKPEGKNYYCVDCVCDCGNKVTVEKRALTSPNQKGRTKSCGCLQREVASSSSEVVPFGVLFGRLTTTKDLGATKDKSGKSRHWVECSCSCGTVGFIARLDLLKSGEVKSCGCLQPEVAAKMKKTHGMSHTHEYQVWTGMKQRCNNPNTTEYELYGGRGISYCPSWENFENFFSDMGVCPRGYELDKIDNNLDYSKENCRWVEQALGTHNQRVDRKNKRTSIYRGVNYDYERNKWMSRLKKNGVDVFRNRYATELEAAIAYDNASEKIYGDRPNKTSPD